MEGEKHGNLDRSSYEYDYPSLRSEYGSTSSLDDIDFRGAEIFTRIPVREQRHLARAYSSYVCCAECEAVLLNPVKHRGAA
ncbi:hypothetical protein GGI1_06462 [Acidithiobacillus sp. GGI-221]|nr:hypothetical protein GGI1_06462 [Acidithiobacillus sp. GGI-221]